MSELRRSATLRWTGEGHRFDAAAGADGTGVVIATDGDSETGPSPMELLLMALGGCMAIDVRMILEKSRVALDALEVRLDGDRRDEVPRIYETVTMHFRLTGPGPADRAKVERAIGLSREKYCSVYHMMRPDLRVETSFELE